MLPLEAQFRLILARERSLHDTREHAGGDIVMGLVLLLRICHYARFVWAATLCLPACNGSVCYWGAAILVFERYPDLG